MVREITCKNGFFYADDISLAFLSIYKGGADSSCFETIFGDKNPLFGSLPLGYKNINLFMNFLEEPKSVDIKELDLYCLDEMIEMVPALVDVACSYTLANGPVERKLYRYEDKRNLGRYENGYLSSLKSTSGKVGTIKGTFYSQDTVALAYRPYGFCPYLHVESILENCQHANEDEYLFMPFVKCCLTDEYEVDNRNLDCFRVVQIMDDYTDGNYDIRALYDSYSTSKDEFIKKFEEDKTQGIASDELCALARPIRDLLKGYCRNKFKFYSELYKLKYEDDFVLGDLAWGQEYVGFRDALCSYFTNTDGERSWAKNDTMHVYVFSDLVESGFIPNNVLGEFYNSKSPSVLEKFLKGPRTDGFKSLTDSEYKSLIGDFNIIFDRNEVSERRVDLCNQIISKDYSDNKSSVLK